MKNVATDEAQFNSQKSQIQNEVQLGETAASIAAKAPVSPETVIEGIKMGEELRERLMSHTGPALDSERWHLRRCWFFFVLQAPKL